MRMRLLSFLGLSFLLFLFACNSNVKTESLSQEKEESETLNYKVHTFYYNWYGNPQNDSSYFHWNHGVLPHWSDHSWDNLEGFSGGEDIGANYYPLKGCYSSTNADLIEEHVKMIKRAGIGVAVITWWGMGSFEDSSIKTFLECAQRHGVQVCFHIEPFYKDVEEFVAAITYLEEEYGDHDALYKVNNKPMYYVYDSYRLSADDWSSILTDSSETSLRSTSLDAVFIGLWVAEDEHEFFKTSGFDGYYTYFASDGFVYGSSTDNWGTLSRFASENNLLFIPCAGPGYIDTRIRPWNAQNTKSREKGKYYSEMFRKAAESKPDFIGITSFNEWHEGTQIEPAIPKSVGAYHYENYEGLGAWYYLDKTKKLIQKYPF